MPNNAATLPGALYQAQWTITGDAVADTQTSPAAGTWGDFPTNFGGGLYVNVVATAGPSVSQARSAFGSVSIRRKSDNVIVSTGTWGVGAFASNGIQN